MGTADTVMTCYGFECDDQGNHVACRAKFVGTWDEFINGDAKRYPDLWFTGVPRHLPYVADDRTLVEVWEREQREKEAKA